MADLDGYFSEDGDGGDFESAQFVEDPELFDISEKKAKSTLRHRKVSLRFFQEFLSDIYGKEDYAYFSIQSFDNLNEVYIECDQYSKIRRLFGHFPSFLIMIKKLKTIDYLLAIVSKVKSEVCAKFPKNTGWCEKNWYSSMRKQAWRECVTAGLVGVKHAPKMTIDEHTDLCTVLCGHNTKTSYEQRALLVFLWQALGRLHEVTRIYFSDLTLHDERSKVCLVLKILRTKIGQEQVDIQMFIQRRTWILCPFNALACLAATSNSSSHLFSSIPEVYLSVCEG